MKYIIDTDIGDDIDDALALLLAMEMGLDIIGITTVFKNTAERAKIAKRLMQLYGRGYEKTPVYAGFGDNDASHLWQYTPQIDEYSPDSKSPDDAVDFIIDSCKKFKDELTVIAIGPFTNIAGVIKKCPDALSSAGRVIIMGGAYFKQYADWNVMCDPESAKIMFGGINNIRCIGADVTHKLILKAEDDRKIDEYKGRGAVEYISELYRIWKEKSGKSTGVLHDPLAIYYAENESICSFEHSQIEVITSGAAMGLTLNVSSYGKAYMNGFYKSENPSAIHSLAKDVNKDKVISAFMKIFDF